MSREYAFGFFQMKKKEENAISKTNKTTTSAAAEIVIRENIWGYARKKVNKLRSIIQKRLAIVDDDYLVSTDTLTQRGEKIARLKVLGSAIPSQRIKKK